MNITKTVKNNKSELLVESLNDLITLDVNKCKELILIKFKKIKIETNIKREIKSNIPYAYIKNGVSEKINNLFYINDDFIVMNKLAIKKIKEVVQIFLSNKDKIFQYSCIEKIINSKKNTNPRYFMYMLLILGNIHIDIPNV